MVRGKRLFLLMLGIFGGGLWACAGGAGSAGGMVSVKGSGSDLSSDFSSMEAPCVKTGIEVLRDSGFEILKGKKVGLITNPTGVDFQMKSTIDILFEAPEVELVKLFSPEHGIRGSVTAGGKVSSSVDEKSGLPVISLYGSSKKPSKVSLADIDVLIYDIQDIGVRSYTYISTMGLAMEAAAECGVEFVVLDRPNPLGGLRIEGNILEPEYKSFVGAYPIPYIYGLTCGELAQLINEEGFNCSKCKLTVVKMEGYKRSMLFKDTGLPWVAPSPHIPYMESAFFYPMSGIVGELGMFSIGVGYTLPFMCFAKSNIKAQILADAMNSLNLQGVRFRPIYYKPYYGYSAGVEVGGVQCYITDYSKAHLTSVNFYFLQIYKQLFPNEEIFAKCSATVMDMLVKVCGSKRVVDEFAKRYKYEDIEDIWEESASKFRPLWEKYLLYSLE